MLFWNIAQERNETTVHQNEDEMEGFDQFKTLKVLKRFMSLVVMVILKNSLRGSTVLDFGLSYVQQR